MISLSPETKQLLEHFASHVHWGAFGNPDDLDRFFDFVISAYRRGEHTLSFDEFSSIIDTQIEHETFSNDAHFLKKKIPFVMMMFEKYKDGIKLLSKFENNTK